MTNIPHSSLTGADLHESKGVAGAGANTVFVADGAGSGSFVKLPAAAISGLANPFGASLFHVREEQIGGDCRTAGTVGAWTTVFLNSAKTNEITGASLSSSQMTLPAGTYFVEAAIPYLLRATATVASSFKARLVNVTSNAALHYTPWIQSAINFSTGIFRIDQGTVGLRGRFTLATASVLQFEQYRIDSMVQSPGTSNNGVDVYAEALIWKVS